MNKLTADYVAMARANARRRLIREILWIAAGAIGTVVFTVVVFYLATGDIKWA